MDSERNETRNELIVIADSAPLLRLAAAGLLDAIRLTNRVVVIVDRIEEEVCGDPEKPYAREIADWMVQMAGAIQHARTVEGAGIAALRARARSPEELQDLKRKMRNSGERAIREYIESFNPSDADSVLVLYEDDAVPRLMQAANVVLTMMTTRAFANLLSERGYNRDAARALEVVAKQKIYNLKPPSTLRIDPSYSDEEAA